MQVLQAGRPYTPQQPQPQPQDAQVGGREVHRFFRSHWAYLRVVIDAGLLAFVIVFTAFDGFDSRISTFTAEELRKLVARWNDAYDTLWIHARFALILFEIGVIPPGFMNKVVSIERLQMYAYRYLAWMAVLQDVLMFYLTGDDLHRFGAEDDFVLRMVIVSVMFATNLWRIVETSINVKVHRIVDVSTTEPVATKAVAMAQQQQQPQLKQLASTDYGSEEDEDEDEDTYYNQPPAPPQPQPQPQPQVRVRVKAAKRNSRRAKRVSAPPPSRMAMDAPPTAQQPRAPPPQDQPSLDDARYEDSSEASVLGQFSGSATGSQFAGTSCHVCATRGCDKCRDCANLRDATVGTAGCHAKNDSNARFPKAKCLACEYPGTPYPKNAPAAIRKTLCAKHRH